ncbi:transposase [Saccharothrix sp. DSM 118769]
MTWNESSCRKSADLRPCQNDLGIRSIARVRPLCEERSTSPDRRRRVVARIEPLLPVIQRRSDHPSRRRLDDREVLSVVLFVLYADIPWESLPSEWVPLRHERMAATGPAPVGGGDGCTRTCSLNRTPRAHRTGRAR